MSIHPSAVVHRGAEVDSSATVGPFCVIGPQVKVGPRTRLWSHVVLTHHTTLGADNEVHPFACLGGAPQDRKYRGEPAHLLIGDRNVIRESVTVNIGTEGGHMQTRVGNDCLLMATAHVAHDCTLGNGVVMANGVALAGHVELHDLAILGGLAAVHQFCRIGRMAFVGGGAMVAQDVPPFCVAQGDRASLAGLNWVGLKRANWPRQRLHALRRAYRALFDSDAARATALAEVAQSADSGEAVVAELCAFVGAAPRGVCHGRRQTAEHEAGLDAPARGHDAA